MEAFMTSLPLRYIIMFTKYSSGMWMTVITPPPLRSSSSSSLLPVASPDGNQEPEGNREAHTLWLVRSSHGYGPGIQLRHQQGDRPPELLGSGILPTAGRKSSAAATIFDVILEFKRSREGRGGGRLSTTMCAAETLLPWAVGAFRFDMVCCIMLDRRHRCPQAQASPNQNEFVGTI
jgi:hypothetical protein